MPPLEGAIALVGSYVVPITLRTVILVEADDAPDVWGVATLHRVRIAEDTI
jgi:hypothetical protein